MSWTLFCMAVPVGAGLLVGVLGAYGFFSLIELAGKGTAKLARWVAGKTKVGRCYVNWSKISPNLHWVAVDEDGRVSGYDARPELPDDDDMWLNNNVGEVWDDANWIPKDAIIGPLPPWRESLRMRPGYKKEVSNV